MILKELIDDGLDACEEQGIAPKITATVTEDYIEVADNGSGIPVDTVDRLLDFSVRVSSRASYVGPTRGAQGQALKSLIGMPYVLDPGVGYARITGGGFASEITIGVDQIKQAPVVTMDRWADEGSVVRICLSTPDGRASSQGFVGEARCLQQLRALAFAFTVVNPHLTLTLDLLGNVECWDATDLEWSKWKPGPASAHWYEADDLERLIAAYIKHDQEHPSQHQRVVRDLLAEDFEGLSSTAKQKRILDATGLVRTPISELVNGGREFDHQKIEELLWFMQDETSVPAKPSRKAARDFGLIGEDHIRTRFAQESDMVEDSFDYRLIHTFEDGVPQITEVAFAAVEEYDERTLVAGVNWSPRWESPFRFSNYRSLDTILTDRRMDEDEPIMLLVHTANPRAHYTNPGKSAVQVRHEDIERAVEAVGRKWTQQRKQEERHAAASAKRKHMWASKGRKSIKEACYEYLPRAWAKASNDGQYPASADQIFYQLRPLLDADDAVEQKLDSGQRREYFKNTILPEYLAERDVDWDVIRGARGTFEEPHTNIEIPISTLAVRRYLATDDPGWTLEALSHEFPTNGPSNRISAVLVCEKEGFHEQLRVARVKDCYDVGLASTKGMSVHAARKLADELGVPILILHDFDKEGISIRSQFPSAIDVGLRIEDIEGIPTERRPLDTKQKESTRVNLRRNGASEAEIEFLLDDMKRVELNAMTAPEFIAFVERKLKDHKIVKVIPDADTLKAAWTRAHLIKQVNEFIEGERDAREDTPPMPSDLGKRIKRVLRREPELAWDDAVWRLGRQPGPRTTKPRKAP